MFLGPWWPMLGSAEEDTQQQVALSVEDPGAGGVVLEGTLLARRRVSRSGAQPAEAYHTFRPPPGKGGSALCNAQERGCFIFFSFFKTKLTHPHRLNHF